MGKATIASLRSIVMVLGAISATLRRSAALIFYSINSFQSLLYLTAILRLHIMLNYITSFEQMQCIIRKILGITERMKQKKKEEMNDGTASWTAYQSG
jgi:hypothetical protein